MANEIQVSCYLSCNKATVMSAPVWKALTNLFTMSGNYIEQGSFTVTTSATAIPLGSVATPGYFFAYNTDATNYVQLMNGSGGTVAIRLTAGQFCIFPWDNSATPYAIANTASCILEYLLLSR